jgi:hypothetical protein
MTKSIPSSLVAVGCLGSRSEITATPYHCFLQLNSAGAPSPLPAAASWGEAGGAPGCGPPLAPARGGGGSAGAA